MVDNLDFIAREARQDLASQDAAREKMLPLCREVIRCSGNAIRAVHRQDYQLAGELLNTAHGHLSAAGKAVAAFNELNGTGVVRDAQKELAEANITLALVTGQPLPTPGELGVDTAAYLNGLGEAVGEIRRYLLDAMRKGDLSRGEELLTAMDDIYSVLVTIDFPDAITGGLRRTTDMVRGVLERTRSDLTLAMRQKVLESKLASLSLEGLPPEEPRPEDKTSVSPPEAEMNSQGQAIYKALTAWRTRKSTEENIAPSIIIHNSILKEIIRLRPSTPHELMAIKGFGERRVNKYGKEILAIINQRQ
jgi:translin